MKSDLFNQYVAAVCDLSGIEPTALFSKNKTRIISDARHLLYYMCSKRMMPVSYIKRYMKDNGYDTEGFVVSYGIKSVQKKIEKDPDYTSIVESIEKNIHF